MKGIRSDLSEMPCGIARALQVVGDWWSLLIVREAFSHNERFSEIQKKLGLAKNILSARLKKLVEDGVLEIRETDGQRRYVLTEKGRDLHVVLVALWQWGEAHCTDKEPRILADRKSGQPFDALKVRTIDNEIIVPDGFTSYSSARVQRMRGTA